jgi:hypothetical protein
MTADIRKLIHATPFVPFTIHLADGGALHVPTVDHISVAPEGGRVVVWDNEGTADILSSLLISRISVGKHSGSRSSRK